MVCALADKEGNIKLPDFTLEFGLLERREGKREGEEVAHIRAGAKTAPIVLNQSAANWYNYRDRTRENTELCVCVRRRDMHTHIRQEQMRECFKVAK